MHCLVLLLPLLAGLVHADQQCNVVRKEFNDCTKAAHQTYLAAMKGEEDGREHFRARKTCNYLIDAIENCSNKLTQNECNTEEQVTAMKDTQISRVMTNIGESVEDFDSCKCPTVKAHINRMKEEKGATVEDCPTEAPATDGASSVLAGLLLLPLLVVHHL